ARREGHPRDHGEEAGAAEGDEGRLRPRGPQGRRGDGVLQEGAGRGEGPVGEGCSGEEGREVREKVEGRRREEERRRLEAGDGRRREEAGEGQEAAGLLGSPRHTSTAAGSTARGRVVFCGGRDAPREGRASRI